MLIRRGEAGDPERALELIGQALDTAEELGMTRLQALGLKVRAGEGTGGYRPWPKSTGEGYPQKG